MTLPRTTTHDWSTVVDTAHLADVRRRAAELAPGGGTHLLLEALAYPAEEAEERGGGTCDVRFLADGSVRIADDGRGTATLVADGGPLRKPVVTTRDVRFFDRAGGDLLPDGHPRRGMSVVAALSSWLEHTNRRLEGAWTQRYEHGVPVTDLVPVPSDGSTGTTVRFRADPALVTPGWPAREALEAWAREWWPALEVRVTDER